MVLLCVHKGKNLQQFEQTKTWVIYVRGDRPVIISGEGQVCIAEESYHVEPSVKGGYIELKPK